MIAITVGTSIAQTSKESCTFYGNCSALRIGCCGSMKGVSISGLFFRAIFDSIDTAPKTRFRNNQ